MAFGRGEDAKIVTSATEVTIFGVCSRIEGRMHGIARRASPDYL